MANRKSNHQGRRGPASFSAGPIRASIPENNIEGKINLKHLTWATLAIGLGFIGYKFYAIWSKNNNKVDLENLKHEHALDLLERRKDLSSEQNKPAEEPQGPPCKPPVISDFNQDVYGGDDDAENVFLGNTCLVRGSRNIIYGAPKTNKTSFSITLAQSIVSGKDYGLRFGLEGKTYKDPVKVLLYDAEMQKNDHKKRYCKSGVDFTGILRGSNFVMTVDQFLDDLDKQAQSSTTDLLAILDNGTKGFGTLAANEVNLLDTRLKEIQRSMNARGRSLTFILILHTTKDNMTVTGSGFYKNFFECMIRLSKKDKTESKYRLVTFEDCRHFEDGRSYVIRKNEESLLFSYDPEKTKTEFKEEFEYDGPKLPLTEEAYKEITSYHKPNVNGYGWGPTFEKVGCKYFNSQSDMIRKVTEWEEKLRG